MDIRPQFTMRINSELWQKVKEIAKKNKRSAVKQIEFILEEYVQRQGK